MPLLLSPQASTTIIATTITATPKKFHVEMGVAQESAPKAECFGADSILDSSGINFGFDIFARMTATHLTHSAQSAETEDDLRYPIGQFSQPASSMAGIRAAHIQTLRLLPERLKAAIAGLDDHQLDTPYRDGGWTVRQVVHHLADSHANAYIRMKLALTEDWPTVKPYDEAAWADLSDARWLPVGVSLDLITALHARWVSLLESLPDAEFHRGYVHPGIEANGGRQNLAQVLANYDWHSRHHTAHINNLRSRMGW